MAEKFEYIRLSRPATGSLLTIKTEEPETYNMMCRIADTTYPGWTLLCVATDLEGIANYHKDTDDDIPFAEVVDLDELTEDEEIDLFGEE